MATLSPYPSARSIESPTSLMLSDSYSDYSDQHQFQSNHYLDSDRLSSNAAPSLSGAGHS